MLIVQREMGWVACVSRVCVLGGVFGEGNVGAVCAGWREQGVRVCVNRVRVCAGERECTRQREVHGVHVSERWRVCACG